MKMKTIKQTATLLMLTLAMCQVNAQALVNSPFGWANGAGTVTGGGSASPVTVTTNSALRSAVSGNNPKVVYVSGTIDLGIANYCNVGSNTTIIGQGSNARLLHGGLYLNGVSNIIIRNISLEDARDPNWECETPTEGGQPSNCTSSNAAYDLCRIYGSSRIWIDHCTFTNNQTSFLAYDGTCDITGGSDYITISYSIFEDNHKGMSLIGGSDSDAGNYRITYAYNDISTDSRNPMVRFGRLHILNNYYHDVDDYCIGVRINSRIYAEGNYFQNCSYPSTLGDASGQIQNVGNSFVNSSPNSFQGQVSSVGWSPSYSYTALGASQVPSHVQANAGAGNLSTGCSPTAITPYYQVDGGSWQSGSNVTLTAGSSVKFGPQPTSGGSWSWSGCGTSGSSREQTVSPSSSCTATATYTNSGGCQSTQQFSVNVPGGTPSEIAIQENETGFCSVDGSVDNNNSGYSGSGFANTTNTNGSGIIWRINVPTTGTYTLRWRYANGGATSRPGNVIVDGSTVTSASFPTTNSWTSWSENSNSEVAITLSAGMRTIRLQATTSSGLGNIDKMEVEGISPSPASCSGSRFANETGNLAANEMETDIKVFPNPATNILFMDLPADFASSNALIFDTSGKLLREMSINSQKFELNIQSLDAGIYFIKVSSGSHSFTRRFLKH